MAVMTAKKKKHEDCPYNEACKSGYAEPLSEPEARKYDDKVRCHDCGEVVFTEKPSEVPVEAAS